MKKYRIKTEQEFIDEYGRDWRNSVKYTWSISKAMDYLFGLELSKHQYDSILDNSIDIDYWRISRDMIKEYEVEDEFVLPERWCIINKYQEVRNYLSEKYDIPEVKRWNYYGPENEISGLFFI